MNFYHNFPTRQSHAPADNLEDEDDAAILLSMCTSAPHLDISIRCTVDTELEDECAVIAWKKEDHDQEDQEEDEDEEDQSDDDDGSQDGSDGSGSWHTDHGEEEPDVTGGDQDASGTDSDEGEEHSESYESRDDDGSSASSGRDGLDLWDEYLNDRDDRPQYLFDVDRENVLESSLNALENMSK